MNTATGRSRLKKLLKTISYWLNYEKLCQKESLFNEKYISYPIGQFLRSRFTKGLHTEFMHPYLKSKPTGSKPKIDFVVVEKIAQICKIKIAIETKWISGSPSLIKDIVRDVLRLALVAEHEDNATCYLIVVGKYNDWKNKIYNNKSFYRVTQRERKELLNLGSPGHSNFSPLNESKLFKNIVFEVAEKLDCKKKLPEQIRVTHYGMFPNNPSKNEYVALGWRIHTYKRNNIKENILPE